MPPRESRRAIAKGGGRGGLSTRAKRRARNDVRFEMTGFRSLESDRLL